VRAAADLPEFARMSAEGRRAELIAEAALVGITAVWGLTFVMVQDAIALLPVTAFLAYRFIPAGGLIAGAAWRRVRSLGPAGLRDGVLMGLALTAGYLLQTYGLERTTASASGFITGLFVVITPVLTFLVRRERESRTLWLSVALATAGLALIASGSSTTGDGPQHTLGGDALTLGCAAAFSIHILLTGSAVDRHDVAGLAAVQLSVCGFICLVVAALAGELEMPDSGTVWSALVVTSLLASALGFLVQSFAQQHATPPRTALILAAEPAFAGLFGFLLAGDRLSLAGWLGALLVMAAIVAAAQRRPEPDTGAAAGRGAGGE
jgi:drug/metabolite transporter (DMT)-like permease